MEILIGVQLFIIILFFLLGWAIRYKKKYGMISGFATRSKEEQMQLIENGLPQKTGLLLMLTAVGMLVLLPLDFTPFPYAIEVQFGFMLVFLLGGFIYLSKFEIEKKRKRSYWIATTLFLVILVFVGGLTYLGYRDYELLVDEETFTITGIYGDQWKIEDIQKIKLLNEMPEVTWKENGFGLQTVAKGYFTVTDYGSSLLFIRKETSAYIYIKVNEQDIFINGNTLEETRTWYQSLSRKVK